MKMTATWTRTRKMTSKPIAKANRTFVGPRWRSVRFSRWPGPPQTGPPQTETAVCEIFG